ncbi:cell wall hydrolase [Sphingomonas sp. CCH15-F11]|uniref:cell wall hydrolase n=2 Tax=unclassified Sphingomonas TaxID=196159 RepID=UPI0008332A28|nr:cell wall hydrolase [Sphingomonas sp. CCH15-F11]
MRADPSAGLSVPLRAAIALVGGIAVVLPAVIVTAVPPARPPSQAARAAEARVMPKVVVPPVEPIRLRELAPRDAVALNASVPFSDAPNPAARPFRFRGAPEDRSRAIDCLAAAMLYEAGDDPDGQRPVAQVVLNRVRHPAFPKSICGVVFQGSDRRTGCQFTFTCDGALARAYAPAQWRRARDLAAAAIDGRVDRRVGHATHYHTDWVVPYWSASLDKIVAVGTHLFFRWTGWWGTPAAFRGNASGVEPRIALLAPYSASHEGAESATAEDPGANMIDAVPGGAVTSAPDPVADFDTFLVALDPRLGASSYPDYARRVCGPRDSCKLLGWRDAALAREAIAKDGVLSPRLLATMSFSYLLDRKRGFQRVLWNCAEFPRDNPRDCMRRGLAAERPTPAPTPVPDASTAPKPLDGIRRKRPQGAAPPAVQVVPAPIASPTAPVSAPASAN